MEEKIVYAALTVYRERGAYLRRLEQLDKAKAAYDEAMKYYPKDVKNLIGRSQVCIDAFKPLEAYRNAAAALSLEPNNIFAKNIMAKAMYSTSEFEKSVVMNYQGSRVRKYPTYFKDGVIQGLEIIQDCIGTSAGGVLTNFLPIIREQEAIHGGEYAPKVTTRMSRMPKVAEKKLMTRTEERKHKSLSRVMAYKYLGPMAEDKFFLESMQKNSAVKSASAQRSQELIDVINSCHETLCERQDMLWSQRPYYAVKKASSSQSAHLTAFKKATLKQEIEANRRNAERNMVIINKFLWANRLTELLAKATRFRAFLDSKTKRTLPELEEFNNNLYRAIGRAYLQKYKLSMHLSNPSNKRRILFLMGVKVGRPTSYDSVLNDYPTILAASEEEMKATIDNMINELEICENRFKRCWLNYEIARHLNKLKNYALAKFYAKKCQREAMQSHFNVWWFNGSLMLMSGDLQQGNLHEVKLQVQEALTRMQQDKSFESETEFQTFLKTLAKLDERDLEITEDYTLKQQEQGIIRVLDSSQKQEARVLFKKMQAIPEGRRFNVLPKVHAPLDMTCVRRKQKQTRLTIVPGSVKKMYLPKPTALPGKQLFEF